MNSRLPLKEWTDIKLRSELKKKKRGYGEIGRRYGLNCIEPWYGNLLSANFPIQRNPGIKNGQSWAKSSFPKPNPNRK